jgi:cytochrome b pre-mRNA-processing protein 3
MFSSLKRLWNPPRVAGGTIEAIYGVIVAQVRDAAFYRHGGVPDTVDGRFDLLVLHLWLVLRRLRAAAEATGETAYTNLAQGLFDHFCSDMDANLREMGVGDLTVPKRMQKFGEAFYGRVAAYDAAFADRAAMREALARNVLNRTEAAPAAALDSYVVAAAAALDAVPADALRAAGWRFPAPPAEETAR